MLTEEHPWAVKSQGVHDLAANVDTTVLSANKTRRYLLVQNLSQTARVFVMIKAEAEIDAGILLTPGGKWEPNRVPYEEIHVICSRAVKVYVVEGQ